MKGRSTTEGNEMHLKFADPGNITFSAIPKLPNTRNPM